MSEEDNHDWVTNGLKQTIEHKIPEPVDRSDRIDHVPEDLASISRDTGVMINPSIVDGKFA
jgi:hypothetical protein